MHDVDGGRIGVGITTRDRRTMALDTLARVRAHTPDAIIVVVDDASTEPFPGAQHRFDTQVGIARAKNKCIELLMEAGVEHLFLFDDDTWPIADDWWRPYVESPEPHLMYLFKDTGDGKTYLPTPRTVYSDSRHLALTHPRGCMLYVHRSAIDAVGGMRREFGLWGWEHVEYSNRIHNAGLTTWRFADVAGSSKLIYSADEHAPDHPGFRRVVDDATRLAHLATNEARYRVHQGSSDRVEYGEGPDVVFANDVLLTVFITGGDPDTQRPKPLDPDPALLATYLESVRGHHVVVLNDELPDQPAWDAEFEKVPTMPGNPYYVRWVHAWQWLRRHPEIRYAWVTDCTDVELLHNPFPGMRPGRLYLGSEPSTVGCPWMGSQHPAMVKALQPYAARTLMNCGIVGGDRETVMGFLHDLLDVFWDWERPGATDMAAFNLTAWSKWTDRLEFGAQIHTVFKAYDATNTIAWFRHK